MSLAIASALQQALDRGDLVVERLLAVAAPVELEHRGPPRGAALERDGMQLAADPQDVLGRALQGGPHRVHAVADPILRGEPALDLGDVRGRAGAGSPWA